MSEPAVSKTSGKRRVGDGTPGPGRPKGVPNKTTVAVKAALQAAFEGAGGVEALTTWAKANQTEFYKLWGRLLPMEVSGPEGAPIQTEVVMGVLEAMTPEERTYLRKVAERLGCPE